MRLEITEKVTSLGKKVKLISKPPINGKEDNKPTYIHDSVKLRMLEINTNQWGDKLKKPVNHVLACKEFKNMSDFIDFYKNLPEDAFDGRSSRHTKGYADKVNRYKTSERSKKWTFGKIAGFSDPNEVTEKAMSGKCPRIVKNYIKKYKNKLEEQGLYNLPNEDVSCKKKRVWTDDGAELDIDAVMSGDPNYWVTSRRDGKYRVVRLVVNYSASWKNDQKTFAKTIAMMYVTAELIEQLGYGVEIYASDVCWSHENKNVDERAFLIPLKKVQEPLDIERLGFIGAVGFFRYHSFAVANELFGYFNGRCMQATQEMQDFMGADVYITTSWGADNSTEKQALNITKAIDKLKGEM